MTPPAPVARPRLVATDLDGTLLRSDGTVSERTRAALVAVRATGIRVVVATARPPRWLHELADIVGDDGAAICANGAFVYDVHARRVLGERTLAREAVEEIVLGLRDRVPTVAFALETSHGFVREPHFVERYPAPASTRVGDVLELLDPLPGKVLARAEDRDPDEFLEVVEAVVGAAAVLAFSGSTGLAEISATGVTKAAVLQEWAERWQLGRDDVWAFGDMPNDLPMLAWAGRSFAVANAHPDVLAAATDICPSNDEDGVAQALETLV